jgi:hypothetical protein
LLRCLGPAGHGAAARGTASRSATPAPGKVRADLVVPDFERPARITGSDRVAWSVVERTEEDCVGLRELRLAGRPGVHFCSVPRCPLHLQEGEFAGYCLVTIVILICSH